MNKFLYEYDYSLESEICNKIINYFENENENENEKIIKNCDLIKDKELINIDKNNIINKNQKNSIDMNISFYNNEISSEITIKLIKEINENLKKYFLLNDYNKMCINDIINKISIDNFIISKFVKNEGLFLYNNNMFYDFYNKKYRLLNFIWYLNDVNEGGETEFFGEYKIKPKIGKIVLFPSEWFFPHTIKKPLSNDEYIIYGSIYIDF